LHAALPISGIQRRYAEFVDTLKRELGVGPALETRELRDRLLAELTQEAEPEERSTAQQDLTVVAAGSPKPRARRHPWVTLAGSAAMLATLGLGQSGAAPAAATSPTVA